MEPDVNTVEGQKGKKPHLILRILAFGLTAVLVLAAVFLIANWEKVNLDSVRRYFAYRSLARTESGQVESFSYNGGVNSSFAELTGDLLVCSSSGVRLYSPSGAAYVDQPCLLKNPVLSVGGSTALVYDAGGTDLFVYRDREEIFSLTGDSTRTILSASLSTQGLLTVVTRTGSSKGSVTVYNSSFSPVMRVNLSSRFVTDAILSPDGKTLALATSGQAAGVYDSQIAFYQLDRPAGGDAPDAVCSLGNNAVLALNWTAPTLRVLGESSLSFVKPDGSLVGTYSYDYRYLKGFSLDGEGFCTLLLGKYRAGTDADLVVTDLTGQELATKSLAEQVLSLSAQGKYLSILTADALDQYTGALVPYHTMSDLQGARKVLQRTDGSVLLIARENARLYLPH